MDAVTLYDLGFTSLVSVVPPDAPVSPNSTINPADTGKVPGLIGVDGTYSGYNWRQSSPVRSTVENWKKVGASVGMLGSSFPAIDIDIMDPEIADAVVRTVEARMGPCFIRTGQWPKQLIIFRCEAPQRSFDMHYGRWDDLLGAEQRLLIQFLGNGRQYVIDGIHPRILQPYTLTDGPGIGMLGAMGLPCLTAELIVEIFQDIEDCISKFGYAAETSPEARVLAQDVNQDDLKAPSWEALRELISRAPNTLPDREDYVAMGYAIRGASQDWPEFGFDLFMEWCSRWEQGYNDPAQVQRDWDKMVPPYRTGYYWLLDKVREWGCNISDLEFGQAQVPTEGGNPQVQASQEAIANIPDEAALLAEDWLATRFIEQNSDRLMTAYGLPKVCFKWTGTRWERHSEDLIFNWVRQFLRSYVSTALQTMGGEKGASMASRLGSNSAITNVKSMVTKDSRVVVDVTELDQDPDILNTPTGPVYLPTGERVSAGPDLRLTKCATVGPDFQQECPLWLRFLNQSTNGDHDLARYLQCLAGYALTGHTREQIFPFFIGSGGNGKSVFIETLAEILGDYATSVPVELFQANNRNSDTPYHLAKLQGARLVTTSETKAGGTWDEQRIKQLTGEDTVNARLPYGTPFTFHTQATLIVIGNHSPDLDVVTEAMVRRMRVIPWDYKPEAPDKRLREKLRAEMPGILRWCLDGARMWYQEGLPDTTAIIKETQDYVAEQDTLGAWAESHITYVRDREAFVTNKELFDSYLMWCRLSGQVPLRSRQFSQMIGQVLRPMGGRRGRHKGRGLRGWCCIKLEAVQDAPTNVVQFPQGVEPPPASS